MKPRKSLSVYVLLMGVLGLLIVGGVFGFQLLDESTKNQLPAAQRELVKPLDGKIETEVIDNLAKRKVFSKDELIRITPTEAPPILSIAPTVEASSSTSAAIPILNENNK